MTPRGYFVYRVIAVIGIAFSTVTPLTIALTGNFSAFQAVLLPVNIIAVVVVVRSWRKMRWLHRDWMRRRDELRRRLRHAEERGDHTDVHVTLALMDIWNVKP